MDSMDSDNDELAFDSGDDEGFELGPRLAAPTAKLYTTQQLHGAYPNVDRKLQYSF